MGGSKSPSGVGKSPSLTWYMSQSLYQMLRRKYRENDKLSSQQGSSSGISPMFTLNVTVSCGSVSGKKEKISRRRSPGCRM